MTRIIRESPILNCATDSCAIIILSPKHLEVTKNSNKVNSNILLDSDVEVTTIEGKSIVCIHVPQADWRMKPVFLNENPYKGSFKRNHEGDYHCTEMEVRAMIRDANEDGNDGGLLDGFTLDDIDANTLHGTPRIDKRGKKD